MRYRISVTPEADSDLLRLAYFLAETNERAARDAASTIKKAIRSLDHMPQRARKMTGSLHVLDVKFGNSGYAIWFSVVGDLVTVTRIFHMREDRT